MAILNLNEAGKDSTAIDKINAHYFDKKAEDYFFNKFLLSFDPSTQQWSYAGESPWYGTAGAAVVNKGDKPGLLMAKPNQDCERMPYLNLISPVII